MATSEKGRITGLDATIDWKGYNREEARVGWRYESVDDAFNGAFCADRWPMQGLNDLSRKARGNIYIMVMLVASLQSQPHPILKF